MRREDRAGQRQCRSAGRAAGTVSHRAIGREGFGTRYKLTRRGQKKQSPGSKSTRRRNREAPAEKISIFARENRRHPPHGPTRQKFQESRDFRARKSRGCFASKRGESSSEYRN